MILFLYHCVYSISGWMQVHAVKICPHFQNRGGGAILGSGAPPPWGGRRGTSPRNRPTLLPHMSPCRIWLFKVKRYERNSGDFPETFDPSRPGNRPSQCNLTRLWLGMSSGRLKSTTWRKFDFTWLGKKIDLSRLQSDLGNKIQIQTEEITPDSSPSLLSFHSLPSFPLTRWLPRQPHRPWANHSPSRPWGCKMAKLISHDF